MAKFVGDAGHGGDKPGAVYDPDVKVEGDEIEEEDINLSVVLAWAQLMRGYGHEVILTRDRDMDVTLEQRKNMINEFKPDAFVSIHCNATQTHKSNGVEAFYRDEVDYPLAKIIQQYLVAITGRRDRGVFQDIGQLGKRLTVLNDSASTPAALIEIGFIDNEDDRMYITKNIYTIAETIADACHDWTIKRRTA